MEIYMGSSPIIDNPNQIYHDATLKGKGTKDSKLKVSLGDLNIVVDSDNLAGEGTVASPLAVILYGTLRAENNLPLQTEDNEFITIEGIIQPQEIKKYVATLFQDGDPTPLQPIELENSIGLLTYTYDSVGWYIITSDNAFTEDKTWVSITSASEPVSAYVASTSQIHVLVPSEVELAGSAYIEIRVYPPPPIP